MIYDYEEAKEVIMKNLALLFVVLIFTGCAAEVVSPEGTQTGRRDAKLWKKTELYTGPMIDAHGHLGVSFDWDMIVKVMGRNNISRQIVIARY